MPYIHVHRYTEYSYLTGGCSYVFLSASVSSFEPAPPLYSTAKMDKHETRTGRYPERAPIGYKLHFLEPPKTDGV